MENPKRVVIAADHTILRAGLRALFSFQNDLEVVGESGDGREAVRVVDEHVPDILLIDFSMPKLNGMETISEIRNRHPQIKIIVLAVHKDAEYIVAFLEAGADAYLLKDANQNELFLAIEYVMSGKIFLSPSISDTVFETYLEQKNNKKKKPKVGVLTSREKEILKLIAKGFKSRDIADHLCISSKTVEKHRSNLRCKLNLRNTALLTAYSIEKNISI
jgi:DNA-binding NarL/FixJ family response regulator